jgi:hypothetical protein
MGKGDSIGDRGGREFEADVEKLLFQFSEQVSKLERLNRQRGFKPEVDVLQEIQNEERKCLCGAAELLYSLLKLRLTNEQTQRLSRLQGELRTCVKNLSSIH